MNGTSFVPNMLKRAVEARASDIHIEPGQEGLCIRFRVDGQLQLYRTLPSGRHANLLSQLKLMANLDIGEKRLPQDGRMSGEQFEARVATIPTVNGEKMVVRILQSQNPFSNVRELGMQPEQGEEVGEWIQQPTGLLLVTGPTGSGKTTTVYVLINELNNVARNIVTLEDPVEIRLPGVNQVQINEKTGLTFARGLRAVVRQDPDVIMIGEIRDKETADMAVRAALTGHLVLTSLHTGDAASALTRLLDMGIPPYLLASSVTGIVAQRLVRKLCHRCRGAGGTCSTCRGSGYYGRVGVFEVLTVDEELQALVTQRPSVNQLRQHMYRRGLLPLRERIEALTASPRRALVEGERAVGRDA